MRKSFLWRFVWTKHGHKPQSLPNITAGWSLSLEETASPFSIMWSTINRLLRLFSLPLCALVVWLHAENYHTLPQRITDLSIIRFEYSNTSTNKNWIPKNFNFGIKVWCKKWKIRIQENLNLTFKRLRFESSKNLKNTERSVINFVRNNNS